MSNQTKSNNLIIIVIIGVLFAFFFGFSSINKTKIIKSVNCPEVSCPEPNPKEYILIKEVPRYFFLRQKLYQKEDQ